MTSHTMSSVEREIVGVDLSLTATGIARLTPAGLDGELPASALWTAAVRVHGKDDLTGIADLGERARELDSLAGQFANLIHYGAIGHLAAQAYRRPAPLVLIETPALSRARGGVFERGYVWFEVVRSLAAAGAIVVGVDPGQIKQYATGKGNVGKGAVIDAIGRRWPMFETGGDDNACDASVLAALGAHLTGRPLCSVPATHAAALGKIKAPADWSGEWAGGTVAAPRKRARKAA